MCRAESGASVRCARCVSACRVWGSVHVDRRSRNKFRFPKRGEISRVKSTKFAIAEAKGKNRNFIEICHTRFEIIASKFPMAAIRNSCLPQTTGATALLLLRLYRAGGLRAIGYEACRVQNRPTGCCTPRCLFTGTGTVIYGTVHYVV